MVQIILYIVSTIVLYPLGLMRLGSVLKISIIKIIRSHSIKAVKEQGKIVGLHIIAVTGSVVLIVMLVLCLASLAWFVSRQLFR